MLDLFSGIGGFSLAARWVGIETAAFCEVDPFCQRVLRKHWPDVPIFDDIRTLDRAALVERGVINESKGGSREPVARSIDLICGGFP